mgnify:CR=1 FL=1
MIVTCLVPIVALAHPEERLAPGELWPAWEFDPGVVIPLLASAFLYARGARRHRTVTTREKALFWCGWAMLAIALVSPLHPLGDVLFSAHMMQHEILMLVAAPLMVLSRAAAYFPLGPAVRMASRPWPLVENRLRAPDLALHY